MDFGIFPENRTISKFSKKCASYLLSILRKNRLVRARSKPGKWAIEFEKLNSIDKVKKKRIKRVLLWYCNNIGGNYIPVVRSARSFREKFDRIEDAIKRKHLNNEKDLSQIKVTKRAEMISERCGGLIWPDKDKNETSKLDDVELKVIQASINNHEAFIDDLCDLHKKCKSQGDEESLCGICEKIIHVEGDTNHFVKHWIIDIHSIVWRWEHWNENLHSFVFTINSKIFQNRIEELVASYCGDREMWHYIKELLSSESGQKE